MQWSSPGVKSKVPRLRRRYGLIFSYELLRKIFPNRSNADATVARRPRTGIVCGSTGTISGFLVSGRSLASLFPSEAAAGFAVGMASAAGFSAGGGAGLAAVALSYLLGTGVSTREAAG